MNGSRSTYMRKGYLLTALAAAVLLAASSGTAYAQRVTIGFVTTSGDVSEKAFLDANSLEEPRRITVRVRGLKSGGQRPGDITASLGDNVTVTPADNLSGSSVYIARVTGSGAYVNGADPAGDMLGGPFSAEVEFELSSNHFLFSDEVVLAVVQANDGDLEDAADDVDWLSEVIELKLAVTEVDDDEVVSTPASVNPDIYELTVRDIDVAPVAKFSEPNFTLSEQSIRVVHLDVKGGSPGARIPGIIAGEDVADEKFADADADGIISIRVDNPQLVMFGNGSGPGTSAVIGTLQSCPARSNPLYNRILFRIDTAEMASPGWTLPDAGAENAAFTRSFRNTGVLKTGEGGTIAAVAASGSADLRIEGCGDGAGIIDPRITLTILPSNLVELRPQYGDITIGAPLTIGIDSDEAAPTLSFSPTDVEIDEGGTTGTVLVAEGRNAGDVKMVKLSVEGDAMVSLMQDGEMLEEMGGYVYVDLGGNSSARLEAMSHSDPDLMDGDMAHKVWKLMEGSAEGVIIGEGSWFKVVVRGSTAVPALPLVGQLLLALFLMAGGARLYRRRQG